MSQRIQTTENDCPRSSLAAYIDGELATRDELRLETHLAACGICAAELNEQKRFLCALSFALDDERAFKLPENFTRVVVARAESTVSGLRSPKERFNAVFVIAALFLMFLLGVGDEIKTVAATFVQIGEQFLTVGSFIAHLIYEVGVGAAVVLRSLSSRIISNSAASVFLTAFFFVAVFALSRFINRCNQS